MQLAETTYAGRILIAERTNDLVMRMLERLAEDMDSIEDEESDHLEYLSALEEITVFSNAVSLLGKM